MLTYTSHSHLPTRPVSGGAAYRQPSGWPGPENWLPVEAPGSTPYLLTPPPTATTLSVVAQIYLYDVERGKVDEWNCKNGQPNAEVMEAFGRYVKYIIEKTWNSSSNPGMSASRVVTCHVNVVIATTNTGVLQSGDLFIDVRRGNARSFISGQRVGTFYISDANYRKFETIAKEGRDLDPPSVQFAGISDLTPAHEFGHVLGLTDRYAYVCYCHPAPTGTATTRKVRRERAHTIPLYVHFPPGTDDPEYTREYRWLFNLMSTSTEGPKPGSFLAAGADNTTIIWDSHDSVRNAHVHVHNTLRYRQLYDPPPTKRIAISKSQLDCIALRQSESLPGSGHVYFKTIDPAKPAKDYVFKGTFIGLIPDSDSNLSGPGFQVVHDDTYDINRNHKTQPTHPRTQRLAIDDQMRFRCRQVPNTWTDTTPQDPAALPFADGFINASLDLRPLADTFSANTVVNQIVVPVRLRALLDLEHLDHRVCIRRYVSNYIRRNINHQGTLQLGTIPPTSTLARVLAVGNLSEIKRDNGIFHPPQDLFADYPDLNPQRDESNPIALDWLFLPFNANGDLGARPGKLYFYTAGNAPAGSAVGHPIVIQDTNPLTTDPNSPVGTVYGGSSADIANIVHDIWDHALPIADTTYRSSAGTFENWNFNKTPLDFWAREYRNRKVLVALVKNGALQVDQDIGGKWSNSGLDPGRWDLNHCFLGHWGTYPAAKVAGTGKSLTSSGSAHAGNPNPKGYYWVLDYFRGLQA